MGNNTSQESRDRQRRPGGDKGLPMNISGPSGGLQMIPTPHRDGTGRPVIPRSFEINRDQLLLAFQYMADYLHGQGANLTIYVAGGAVNTVYLRSRHSTGDVDFFGSNEQSRLLKDASKYAQQHSKSQLGANWFNNSMSLFLGRAMEQDLMGASHLQNAVLFSKSGLTVYAVLWEYALCGKTDRLTKPNKRPYDTADAVAYLHQCVKANGEHAIQAQQIETWARNYNKAVSATVLMEIDTLYKSKYGKHGILF
ncbi:uncharacterized protein N7500_000235 [Penicillium coprophilum]|uniref:uncharacterized protein n=1 Tax=Penicillium coprophilum TaxID=36646 RepID=UPI0023A1CF31|nr:uncharacterized protein N7500_000235 [Penicillium coprophilum]KAJ5177536.1 hypothetical protein N7500_000235 [Penicillium coprophilum]